MFREMRKRSREIFNEEILEILNKGEYGVLSTVCDNGYPYSTPINYVYFDNSLYFHCALKGLKIDNIGQNPKVSFAVVTDNKVVQADYTSKYESVVVFGTASIAIGELKQKALLKLIEKYAPDFVDPAPAYIEKYGSATAIVKIEINHMTGKANK